ARQSLGERQPAGSGLCGLVIAGNRAVRSADLGADPRAWQPELAAPLGMRSWLGVPLADADGAIGVLEVVSGEPDVFTDEDERRLGALAALASAAVREARLLED